MSHYKYILFDADETLFDFSRASKVAFTETLSAFSIPYVEDTFETYLYINKSCWEKLEKGEITPQEIKSLRFQLFLDAVGETGDALALNDFYLDRLAEKDFQIDGAGQLLGTLKEQDFSLGLITNGLKKVQRPRIEQAGWTAYFDAITVSEEIGQAKPAAAFFEDTFQQLNYPPKQEALIIGDNLKSDIAGGNNIGVDTVWFNPHGLENKTIHEPTFTVANFTELKKIIGI